MSVCEGHAVCSAEILDALEAWEFKEDDPRPGSEEFNSLVLCLARAENVKKQQGETCGDALMNCELSPDGSESRS